MRKALTILGVNFSVISFLYILLLSTSFSSATPSEFGYNYLDDGSKVLEGENYTINVNNTDFLQGYSVSTLYTYYKGLLDTYYAGVYVPYLGAIGYVDLGGNYLIADELIARNLWADNYKDKTSGLMWGNANGSTSVFTFYFDINTSKNITTTGNLSVDGDSLLNSVSANDGNFSNYVSIGGVNNYSQLTIEEDIPQGLTGTDYGQVHIKGGVNANDYATLSFTAYNNPNPIAKIGVQGTTSGSNLCMGTSNNYASGVTNEGFCLAPSGNLGIGTDDPQKRLHLVVGAGDLPTLGSQMLLLQDNNVVADNVGVGIVAGTSGKAFFQFGDSGHIARGQIQYDNAVDGFIFNTAQTTAMSIDSSQNIHIVTDSKKMYFGTGDDASLYYDGTNLNINPKDVGSGSVNVLGSLNQTLGNFTGNNYYGFAWFHNDTGLSAGTLNDTYQILSVFGSEISEFMGNGFINSSNGIQLIEGNGVYDIAWKAVGVGVQNHDYHGCLFINETCQYGISDHATGQAQNEIALFAHGKARLNAGDVLTIRVKDTGSSGAGTVIIASINVDRVAN